MLVIIICMARIEIRTLCVSFCGKKKLLKSAILRSCHLKNSPNKMNKMKQEVAAMKQETKCSLDNYRQIYMTIESSNYWN